MRHSEMNNCKFSPQDLLLVLVGNVDKISKNCSVGKKFKLKLYCYNLTSAHVPKIFVNNIFVLLEVNV